MFHFDQIDPNDPNHPPELLELVSEIHEAQLEIAKIERLRGTLDVLSTAFSITAIVTLGGLLYLI